MRYSVRDEGHKGDGGRERERSSREDKDTLKLSTDRRRRQVHRAKARHGMLVVVLPS
jgi:hypothetical protein